MQQKKLHYDIKICSRLEKYLFFKTKRTHMGNDVKIHGVSKCTSLRESYLLLFYWKIGDFPD